MSPNSRLLDVLLYTLTIVLALATMLMLAIARTRYCVRTCCYARARYCVR
jgi:hypothetical protein